MGPKDLFEHRYRKTQYTFIEEDLWKAENCRMEGQKGGQKPGPRGSGLLDLVKVSGFGPEAPIKWPSLRTHLNCVPIANIVVPQEIQTKQH